MEIVAGFSDKIELETHDFDTERTLFESTASGGFRLPPSWAPGTRD